MRSVLRTALATTIVLSLAAATAFAGDDLDGAMSDYERTTSHQDFTAALRPTFWYPVFDGDVRLDTAFDAGTTLDIDRDLGVADAEATFGGELDLRFGDFDLWISGFTFSRSGSSTVTRTVEFGDISFSGSADLDTEFDFSAIGPRIGWSPFGDDASGLRFGPTIGVRWVSIDLRETATGDFPTMRERIDESAPVPALGLRLEVPLGEFLLTGDARGMTIHLSDFDGTYYDLSAELAWRPFRNVGVFVGYRYVRVDATGTSNGDDYDLDLKLHGPFAGFEIRF